MIRLCAFLMIIFFSLPVMAQEEQGKGILRGLIWGLPKEVIIEYEKGKFIGEEENTILFNDKIRGLWTIISYEFDNNKLWRARIFIEERHNDPQEWMEDLLIIQTDLNKRFGAPIVEEMKWINKRELNYPDAWGWAVFRSELFMISEWRKENTQVTTSLGAVTKYKPVLSVTYAHTPTKIRLEQRQETPAFLAP